MTDTDPALRAQYEARDPRRVNPRLWLKEAYAETDGDVESIDIACDALAAAEAAPLDEERQLNEYRENMQRLAVALDQQDRDFAALGLSVKTLARVFSETTVLQAVSSSTARKGTMLPNTAHDFAEAIAREYAALAATSREATPPSGFVECPLCQEPERPEDMVAGVCLSCADAIAYAQNARRGAVNVP